MSASLCFQNRASGSPPVGGGFFNQHYGDFCISRDNLDILVDPTPGTSIFYIGEIRYQLRTLLGVSVDVLTPQALHIGLRDQVIAEALPV
jgi:hypothetical protein